MHKVKSTAFSRFIRYATEAEQQKVYAKVLEGIEIRQKRMLEK